MTKLLKKGEKRCNCTIMFARCFYIGIIYFSRYAKSPGQYSKVFETPKGLPPMRDHDHAIHMILGSVPPNIRPYRYPYVQKSETERMVAEILEAGIIQPSQSPFSAPVVLVHKKDG